MAFVPSPLAGAFGVLGALACVASLATGCSGAADVSIAPAPASTTGGPVAPPSSSAAAAAVQLRFPEVLSRGGPVIAKPRVLPILFAGDANVSHVKAFDDRIGHDPYWTSVGAEYGIGPLTAASPIVMTPAPVGTLTSTELETWLQKKLLDGTFGAPDRDTLYAVFLPPSVTLLEETSGGKSCEDFAGFHYELDVRGVSVGYAVLPECSDVNDLTVSMSHEYFEWATDPFPDTAPAFNKLTPDHWAWEATMMGELSDLCDFLDQDYPTPPGIGYQVQRQWSNALSPSGALPCSPKKGVPYVQAIALASDAALVPDYDSEANVGTKAIRVEKGATRKVDVFVYSDEPTENVTVKADSFAFLLGDAETSGFSYRLSRSTANSGETIELSITAPSEDAFDLVAVSATIGEERHFWPVLVVNDDAAAPGKGIASVHRPQLPRRAKHGGARRPLFVARRTAFSGSMR
jgi:hypothetical protein